MIFRQFLHSDPNGISYLAACGTAGVAAIIDPVGDIDWYLDAARIAGTRIRYVIDTHIHADHISAARSLAAAADADYALFAGSAVSFPFIGVRDGEVLQIGNTHMQVLHTPGHTPEHISLLVSDLRRGDDAPWFVLTGHTLMVGDMGRTELATSAADGARALCRSAARLRDLPDHIEVMPGAYAGSVCGRHLSGKPMSTIGFEKRHNQAFAITDEAAFVRFMLTDVPPVPPGATEIRAVNAGFRAAAE